VSDPELREPDLPRTMKERPHALRTGWTTGACSAAAAKAAALLLRDGAAPAEVDIPLPRPFQGNDRATFAVARAEAGDGWAEAVVVKDAGDDPDVTDKAQLMVRLEPLAAPEVEFRAGEGVGTVTKPGLGLEVGGPAINPVPRRMISQAVGEVLHLDVGGVRVTISVPDGERMARKTTNRRLGILGGISILGTTGIVRPFSTASWRASVEQAVDVLAAQGVDTVVLATGGRTERAAMGLLPDLDESQFVEVGDFTGAALRHAVDGGLRRVVFVGMAGKLTKLASGILMTHYTRSKVDTGVLAEISAAAGAADEVVEAVRRANTGRHAAELWAEHGVERAPDLLCARVESTIARFTAEAGRQLEAEAAMVDFDGEQVLGASPSWRGGRR
jgi:cobalt-precorrin-5B (C1)-methyltransferase